MFKRGQRVKYHSTRGTRSGVGKIVDVIETQRGLWYEVKDESTKENFRFRASCLNLA